jgi:hypothetical protein
MATVKSADDWIEHDGAGCPVSDLAMVQIQFRHDRDRQVAQRLSGPHGNAASAYGDSWEFSDGSEAPCDIVAYRVVA